MFESRTLKLLQAENAALRGQISDLHSREMTLMRQWAEERRDLLNRIMSLAQPLALREMNRPPMPGSTATAVAPQTNSASAPVERNWPRAIVANRPDISPEMKEKQLAAQRAEDQRSDLEAAADFERSRG